MGYLVISRRLNERITIGEDIEILISDINVLEGKVDIAIAAPKNISIKRKETHLKEDNNKKKAKENCGF